MTDYAFDGCALELGVFFVMLFFCSLYLLQDLRWKVTRVSPYMIQKKFYFLSQQSKRAKILMIFFRTLSYFYLISPIVALITWSMLVLYDQVMKRGSVVPAFCILFAGLSFIFMGLGILKMT